MRLKFQIELDKAILHCRGAKQRAIYGVFDQFDWNVEDDEVSVLDFVFGSDKPPVPIRIDNAFGTYELSGDHMFTCQAQVQAYFAALLRIVRGISRQV